MHDFYEHIEDYLDGVMNDQQRQDFERDAAQNPALATTLREVQETRKRLARQEQRQAEEAALKETLQTFGKQYFGETPPPPPAIRPKGTSWMWWLILLAALLTAVVLLWPKSPPDARLYAAYRQFPNASFTFKGSVSGNLLQQAEQHFNAHDYTAALEALQLHTNAHPSDLEARLFRGLCELETGQTEAAIQTFRSYNITGGVWVYEARWYMALAYVRQKKWGLSAELLLQITPGQPHYEEAQALLKEVSKQKLNG